MHGVLRELQFQPSSLDMVISSGIAAVDNSQILKPCSTSDDGNLSVLTLHRVLVRLYGDSAQCVQNFSTRATCKGTAIKRCEQRRGVMCGICPNSSCGIYLAAFSDAFNCRGKQWCVKYLYNVSLCRAPQATAFCCLCTEFIVTGDTCLIDAIEQRMPYRCLKAGSQNLELFFARSLLNLWKRMQISYHSDKCVAFHAQSLVHMHIIQ